MKDADGDGSIGAMVLTGSEKAFAGMQCTIENCR